MNAHRLKHGDVVISRHGIYRMYVQHDPHDEVSLRCMALSHVNVYDLKYAVGDVLSDGETFMFNLIDLCANTTQ